MPKLPLRDRLGLRLVKLFTRFEESKDGCEDSGGRTVEMLVILLIFDRLLFCCAREGRGSSPPRTRGFCISRFLRDKCRNLSVEDILSGSYRSVSDSEGESWSMLTVLKLSPRCLTERPCFPDREEDSDDRA
jgi:hypothetical protein